MEDTLTLKDKLIDMLDTFDIDIINLALQIIVINIDTIKDTYHLKKALDTRITKKYDNYYHLWKGRINSYWSDAIDVSDTIDEKSYNIIMKKWESS